MQQIRSLALAFVLSVTACDGFVAPFHVRRDAVTRSMAKDDEAPSGSFFNQVPADDKKKKKSDEANKDEAPLDDLESSFRKLMKKRSKPKASTPSTINGVPTSQAKGFGTFKKTSSTTSSVSTSKDSVSIQSSSSSSYVGIGPPDSRPLNDINRPEYDDQGYTLYADEKTGEKKRVFEALVEYPCEFTMKIVGANEASFVTEMVQVVADTCGVSADMVKHTGRRNGKWASITVQAPVQNAEMLYTLYENIDRDPRVKFKF